LFISLLIQIPNIKASESILARIGDRYFDTLEEAILQASSTDIIILTNNVTLEETLEINKTVNINLNNHNIEADEKVFFVQGGSLNLSGNGKVLETKPNYGAIMLKGSNDPNKVDYSTVSVGSGVTLEGWSGIFINHENNTAYGILVNMNGNIKAVNDVSGGTGIGIYVNGNIKNDYNCPIINLSNTTKIVSSGNGIYATGCALYNINGAYIAGVESALGIKAGSFNITDGNIIGIGPDKTPTSGNNNGIYASGTAIQIESNSNYNGNIELVIKNGIFESKNSNVIYEYVTNGNSTQVKNININGGSFISNSGKNVFSLSDNFKNTYQKFIDGGTYSSNPTDFIKNGYTVVKNSDLKYEVISNTIAVFAQNDANTVTKTITILIMVIFLFILIILNRSKILDLFKLNKRN